MKPRTILQSQSAECGLACLAMVASAHGRHFDLVELRRRFPVSLKGATLKQLLLIAGALGMSGRPLRCDVTELSDLKLPCILHWEFRHFVVLIKVTRREVVVLDPAVGERRLTHDEVSARFTGVALELFPIAAFGPRATAPRPTLRELAGDIHGLWPALAAIFAVALALESFAILGPLFNQIVIDDAIASHDQALLTVLLLGFGLLLLIQTGLSAARGWMVMVLSQNLSIQWAGNVFAHLLRLPVGWFEQRHLGDIVSRFGAVGTIQRTVTTALIEAVLDGLMTLAALAMMLMYSVKLTAVVITGVALYALVRAVGYGPLRRAAAERLTLAARENSHFLETLRAMQPLKLFGRESERLAQWQNLVVDVQNRDVRTAKLQLGFSTANTLVAGCENLLVFWLGARMVMGTQPGSDGAFTIGMLLAFTSYKTQFAGRLSALINFTVELRILGLHAERLSDIVLASPEQPSRPSLPAESGDPLVDGPLVLASVRFRYGDGEPWVLSDVDLSIEPGEHVAIVGVSGAGKSTLLKILLGIVSPTGGDVLYAGVPVRQLGLDRFRSLVGTVMQEDVLLTGTVADNIAFFDVEPDQAQVEACARLARIHDEIVGMPMGYYTLVGDLGAGLSGGQRQRVLLARALYKRPKILALDEATSHLDIDNERSITATLAELQLTRIVIAHRPETIASAQRVLALQGGRLTELDVTAHGRRVETALGRLRAD